MTSPPALQGGATAQMENFIATEYKSGFVEEPMEQKLFTELRPLYVTSRECPHEIRIRIRMRDLIDPDALRHAVDTTMTRYPYFCVELQKKEGQYIFAENHRPVVITHSLHGVELNSEDSNLHMIAFSWYDNWLILDVFHGMTDGAGAYEILRTLLYYYCSERYHVVLQDEGIRLAGDDISMEEWLDPAYHAADLPVPRQFEFPKALDLVAYAGLEDDHVKTVYSIAISESEFMRFNIEHDGSPGTMVALLLSRAIAKLYPNAEEPIRVTLCVNQRKALHSPLAHQSLVGGVMLEYKRKLRTWPLDKQATAYRGMVFAQTREEIVLAGVNSQNDINKMFLSMETDQERLAIAGRISDMTSRIITAIVSYVGKANYKEAERYIRDFRLWTSPTVGFIIEISAVNGRFTLDIAQPFSSPIYVNAFLKELEEQDITYDLQDVNVLELPNIRLPWSV